MAGKELKGVGGWLLLLILGLTVFNPLLTLSEFGQMQAELANAPNLKDLPEWQQLQKAVYTSAAVDTLIRIAAGLMLAFHHKPISPKIAVATLWLSSTLAFVILYMMLPAELASDVIAELPPDIIKVLLSAIVWSLYLRRSTRVWNTYFEGK